jgi:ankyrin repeat protein
MGDQACCELLVNRKARLDFKTSEGQTAIMAADAAGFDAVSNYLAVDATLSQAKLNMKEKTDELSSFENKVRKARDAGEKRTQQAESKVSTTPAALWEKTKKDCITGIVWANESRNTESIIKAINLAKDSAVPYADLLQPKPQEKISPWDEGALLQYARENKPDGIRAMLAFKVLPDTKDLFGESALHIAAETNGTEVLYWLLRAKANPRGVNKVGETALTVALLKRHAQIVYLLRSALANPNGISEDAIFKANDCPRVSQAPILD